MYGNENASIMCRNKYLQYSYYNQDDSEIIQLHPMAPKNIH